MSPRVCVLVEAGDTPGRNPLLPPLRVALAEAGVELVSWDPTGSFELPLAAPDADLYLLKGDHPAILSAAACLAAQGAPCLNGYSETAAAADKALTLDRVARAGVPVPATAVVGQRLALGRVLAAGPRVVKPVRGAHGDGVLRLGPGEEGRAGPGPWLVQEILPGDGWDLKVYGVGPQVALRRVRFVPGVVDGRREPVPHPDPALAREALAAARAAGLTCFGADFMIGSDGPVLVDLNAFPGYRGVPEAAGWVARAALEELAAP